jgi:uncharacterized protein with HEPN domain
MLEAAQKAIARTEGTTVDELKGDEDRVFVLVHLLEILGEAARGVSAETKEAHPEIPWIEMAATRDRLIHGYFSVDVDIVWQIVRHDLPQVIRQIKALLEEPA